MKKEEIIKILKEADEEVQHSYKARIKGIFGSFVRGEEKAESDVDVLVTFEEGANRLTWLDFLSFWKTSFIVLLMLFPMMPSEKRLETAF